MRFNAGEVTAIEYLKNHPLPPEGERTAFLFVGKDRWANQEMNKTREGIDGEGRFEAFGVHPKTFNKLMGEIIREVERTQPHMRKARQSYALLSQIDVEEPQTPTLPKSGRNFVSFVTRVLDETPAQERER